MGTLLGRKVYSPRPGHIMFRCPGCDDNHGIPVDGSRGWSWSGDGDKPTVTPSILVRGVKLARDADGKWVGWERDADGKTIPLVCHSFVQEGRWQFLSDCTHDLAGQTVEIPDWPYGEDC